MTEGHKCPPSVVDLPENYRNSLSCGLAIVEDMLSDITGAIQRATGPERNRVKLPASAHLGTVQRRVQNLREQIETIRKGLNLHRRSEALGATILSRCTKVWQVLCDLKTGGLKGYGDTPPGLPGYLDPRIDEMLKKVDDILEATKTLAQEGPQQPAAN